jgi:hypothetical protein
MDNGYMTTSRGEPDEDEPDELDASIDVHEVLRCARGGETRIYNLHVVSGGAELWRITVSVEAGTSSIRECEFTSSEETSKFLEELRRALVAGGWRQA